MYRSFDRVDGVLQPACGSAFTGAVARIEHRGRPIFERAYGSSRLELPAQPVLVDTRFDLASLTKLFVATLALHLVTQGALTLDAALVPIVPEWGRDERSTITLRMLLAHNSGMNSGADYRAILGDDVERYALERALVTTPTARVVYSDLGFIALGVILERVANQSLATSLRGLFPSATLGFRPRATERTAIPATEDDGWRGRVQGYVHDEKAYLMGGVAGHAGLFGTAADVAALTGAYLSARRGDDQSLLSRALALEAIREQAGDAVLRRGLGWALKTTDDNSCGRWMDASSFGHTGFVGTSVWADPTRDVQGILLTNSVYFGRNDIRDLRAAFYEAMIEVSDSFPGLS
jgi:serine-type D-Ala-D-Ala carboxypeptidase